MAGSIADNTTLYKKKTYTYVPPSPPAELIDSLSYTIDFAARKFLQIGIDPSEKFQVVVHVLTSSRYVLITVDLMKRIFSYMGNILSFILATPPNILHAPATLRPQRESVIKYAPRINQPAVPTGSSNIMSDDDICMAAMDNFEQEQEDKEYYFYTTGVNGKRVSTANTSSAVSSLETELKQLLKTRVQEHPIKFNLKLEASYSIPSVPNSMENRAFKTSAVEIFVESDISAIIQGAFDKLLSENETYASRGSGFTLQSIDGLMLTIYKYMPLEGSSYIQLPALIDRKRATINPQNLDQQCFKWAILARYVTGLVACRVGDNYRQHEGKYNFEGISFPTPLSDIKKFEKNNTRVSINVYGLEKKFDPTKKYPVYNIYPIRVVDEEKSDHFDLLFTTCDDNSHYTYITSLSRLVRSQKTRYEHSFKSNGREALEEHKLFCGVHKPIFPEMPKEGECTNFKKWKNTVRQPFVIYADFEALLVKTDEVKGGNTKIIHKHEAMSYGFLVKASDDVPTELIEEYEIPTVPVVYRGDEQHADVAKCFVEAIVAVSWKIEKLMKTNIPLTMTKEEEKTHQECNTCNLCKCILVSGEKVRDHNHLTGKFRQTLCSKCNLELQQPKFVPVFFHNLSNYDSYFIVTELGFDTESISVIPNSEEKFISFTKHISSKFTIRFIDTFRFMASSLSSLAENLITHNFENFRETAKHFVSEDMPLVTRKGVYPYEYIDSWTKLDVTCLPGEDEFYSTLTESGIKEEDFKHAKAVWDNFKCKTLGEYSDLYLKIDVLLLADVFENFRDVCMSTYNLDAAHYYTAPGLSFDAMLKYTGQKLELLSDYDMLLMFENGIRGGLVQASMRYAKANNLKSPNYDETKEKSWLVYQDCNNLYGYAMSEYMPYNGLSELTSKSARGRVYEVDISYPQHLHDKHNDLPFLPQNSIPQGSKVRKLMATFERKENYIVHYRNLQQAIDNGLIVEKGHRVLEFSQSDWLAKYIQLNTEMRKKARNQFEKDFFKLMNNAIFGKTMQSKRKEIKMELVSCERRLQKLINKTTFKHCTKYSDTLSSVTLENKIIKFDKPIYIGFAVLDISKTLMYDYHYNVMQRHYGEHIKLMYTDTDSLVYHIMTDDFYSDLLENPNLMDRLDTADLPSNHPCYTTARKKVPGFFSDESKGDIISEFCALRAKSYAYKIHSSNTADTVGRENIKAKGVRHHVVKNHMTLEDHRKCLFGEAGVKAYQENVSIRSFKHKLLTIRTNKLTYNSYDDKRVVLDDKINTLAHGHYSIEKDESEFWPELELQLDPEGQPWTDSDKELYRMLVQCLMEYMFRIKLIVIEFRNNIRSDVRFYVFPPSKNNRQSVYPYNLIDDHQREIIYSNVPISLSE
ncbi:hypothetical protein AGLY_018313 [Aphis glycines]|uniref:DNA-directed DNA polymerase n=1 Tax=Aphis glycines TaxID=307491 RepID=A0A6G0STK0_APHGL|nr:hypothetical protein AGLY_018313 [Aphis glycines]